jgi:hypothetical protein
VFLKQKNENHEIHKIPVNEFDSLMANFIISAMKKDGSDYGPTSPIRFVSFSLFL